MSTSHKDIFAKIMSRTLLPNNRMNSDWFAAVTLTDNDVAVDWSTLVIESVIMLSEKQDFAFAGCLRYAIDEDNPTKLHVCWPAASQLYEGIHRIAVQVVLEGDEKTYDKRCVNVVPFSDSAQTVYDNDETDIELTVSEVDTSIMTAILRACQQATVAANTAASHGPNIGINGNWFVWDNDAQQYVDSGVAAAGSDGQDGITPHIGANGHWYIDNVDTGVAAQGPQGERGLSGNINYPTFSIDATMHLNATALQSSDADRFDIDDAGHLQLTI